MTLKDLEPLSKTEKEMVERLATEDEAVSAIVTRRQFLRRNKAHEASLAKEQYRGRFACHNEKETATMPILQQEDY